jgi:hypothetical protein
METVGPFVSNLLNRARRGIKGGVPSARKVGLTILYAEVRQKVCETNKSIIERVEVSVGKKLRMKLNCALLTTMMEIGPKSV